MSVTLYDEAVINKLRSWVGDSRLKVMSSSDVSQFLATSADEANDQYIDLPIISVTRSGFQILTTERGQLSSYGLTLEANPEKSIWLNGIPIGLEYQIDIYTRYMEEANEYLRNMIFNIINFNRVTIELPYYDQKLIHNSSMHIHPEVQDNSSVSERLIYGQFTRMTITVEITDAYLFDLRLNNNASIDFNIYSNDETIKEFTNDSTENQYL